MKMSRRELSIDMVIHTGAFENNRNTIIPGFTYLKQGL